MIGRRIKQVREQMGIKCAELARLVDVSPSYISRVEGGIRRPSIEIVEAIEREARKRGIQCHLVETLTQADDIVLELNHVLQDPSVSDAKKASIRRLVLVLVRSS